MNDDIRLLVRVATLYYKQQLVQSEIAARVGVSRQTVGRLLQRASEIGIVKVEIQQPFAYIGALELELEDRFGLADVIVVSPIDDSDESIKAALGEAGASYLKSRVAVGDILGFSSGSTTIYQLALHLEPTHTHNVTVVSLSGTAPHDHMNPNIDLSVMLIGRTLNAKTVLLPAPRFVDDFKIKASLMRDSNIAAVIDLGRRANIAVLGIGFTSEHSTPYRQGFFGKDLLETIRQRGAVGEIIGHAYDIDGAACSPEISERSIAIEIEALRAKPLALALAGGAAKVEAIYGAIRGGYLNTLITDETAARGLLALADARDAASTRSRTPC